LGNLNNASRTNVVNTDSDVEMIDTPSTVGQYLYQGGKDDVKVEPFYGDRAKLAPFLIALKVVFRLNPARYQTGATQVMYAAMQLKGPAEAWFRPILSDYVESGTPDDDTKACFRNFAQFEVLIKQVFGTINEERAASREIYRIKQTGSAAAFFSEFQRIAKDLRWDDEDAFAEIFYNGLKPEIRRHMMNPPTTYKKMVDEAISIDNRLFELRQEDAGPRRQHGRGGYQRGYHFRNRRNNYGDPMDLDAMKIGSTSRAKYGKGGRGQGKGDREKDYRRKENLCYTCGKSGHHANKCQDSTRGLHMMNMEGGDADGSVAKKADTIDKTQGLADSQGNKEAQKDHRQSDGQTEPGESRIEWLDDDTWLVPVRNRRKPKKDHKKEFEERLKADKAQEAATTDQARRHAHESWHFCYDDDCPAHISSKIDNAWYPHAKHGSSRPQKHEDEDQETLAVMTVLTDDIIIDTDRYTVMETYYWWTPPAGGVIRYNPMQLPKADKARVTLEKCNKMECFNKGTTHSHDSHPGTLVQLPIWALHDSSRMWDKTISEGPGWAKLETYKWDLGKEWAESSVYFNPKRAPRKEKKEFVLTRCINPNCSDKENSHTHDTLTWETYFIEIPDLPELPAYAELAVADKGPPDEVLYETSEHVAIRTNYWNKSLETGLTKYDPKGKPQSTRKTVWIQRCSENKCQGYPAHTHDTANGQPYQYPFNEEVKESDKPEEDHEVVVAHTQQMVFNTNYYQVSQVNGKEQLTFHPTGKRQEQRKPVKITGCYDLECRNVASYHTHDTVGGVMVEYDPHNQTIGKVPAKLNQIDEIEEWEQVEKEPDKTEATTTTGSKLYPITVTRNWIKVATNYWKIEKCKECHEDIQPHEHVRYDPKIEPRRTIMATYLSFCGDETCRWAPTVHAHPQGQETELIPINLTPEVAIKIWGTNDPTMEDLQIASQSRRLVPQVDSRAEKDHAFGYFTCVMPSCPKYYETHQHQFNVDPDQPTIPIPRGAYWGLMTSGRLCHDDKCRYPPNRHLHTKNEH
jgi:hypothetical protein